jgi:hypothetical protein
MAFSRITLSRMVFCRVARRLGVGYLKGAPPFDQKHFTEKSLTCDGRQTHAVADEDDDVLGDVRVPVVQRLKAAVDLVDANLVPVRVI